MRQEPMHRPGQSDSRANEMGLRTIRRSIFAEQMPDATLGAWLMLFVVWCITSFNATRGIIDTIRHPEVLLAIHAKPTLWAGIAWMLPMVAAPAIGGILLFNLGRQRRWARTWTLGSIALSLALSTRSILEHAPHSTLRLADCLLAAAALLLLTPNSRKWFLERRPLQAGPTSRSTG
ncbi:hypothetical protein LGM43_10440 [Burkholderia seminalis]|uniref:hypothetical protein n=1 Tax=Burkholderia seminalis TaxID=488731 RepID=UPI001CF4AB44|nr:hypothetical protein [Burkholderia seminalis]MCA7950692.1 hypothetical protein [Burkholderia seminalis]